MSAAGEHDVVLVLSYVSWRAIQARGFCFPEDRLVETLLQSDRVDRLLVCEPYRSAPVRALREWRAGPDGRFPEEPGRRTLASPTRLRRRDPRGIAALERTYAAYESQIRAAARKLGMERPAVIVANPLLAGLGRFEWASTVTFYAFDDWASYPPKREWWPAYRAAAERVRESGRGVVAVSDEVLERLAPTGPGLVVPNGVDPGEWAAPQAPPAWFTQLPAPRLLYLGSLDHRLDVEALAAVAAAMPEASVVLAGSLLEPDHLTPLRALANVTIHEPVGRETVVALTAAADVCLIPHRRSPLSEAMSPLKLFEYLAGGRPVASTRLGPIERVGNPRVVLAGDGPGEFLEAVRSALRLGPASDAEREAFVRDNAWRRRHEDLLALALGEPTAPDMQSDARKLAAAGAFVP